MIGYERKTMSATEAVEYMKKGNRVTHKYRDDFWYQLYSNGSVYSLIQDTPCAAKVLGVWNTTDEFIKKWDKVNNRPRLFKSSAHLQVI